MADYQYINDTGLIVADTSDLLTAVQNEWLAVFGSEMSTDASTPQGLMITAETLARDAVMRNNVDLANQINPNIAGGVFLKSICALTGLDPIPATHTTVTAQITGIPGVIVTSGSQAKTAAGDVFEVTTSVVIGSGGTATAYFQSLAYGPIPCASNALTIIVSGPYGWETVTNADAGLLGIEEQSDASLRKLRKNTLALQGTSLSEAITSGLFATDGVTSLQFRENVENTTQTIDGISLVAHSVWACVKGGTDQDVALSLLENKSAGANWNGSTTVSVVDKWSGQSYTVKFDRPTQTSISVRVTVRIANSLLDATSTIKQAVVDYANGTLPGFDSLGVGISVSPFEIAAAVASADPGIYVQKVEISNDGGTTWQTTEIAIALDHIATITSGNVLVVIL